MPVRYCFGVVSEMDLIKEIELILGQVAPTGEVWIGDDCALVGYESGQTLITCDQFVQGVHFDITIATLCDIGFKASTTAISDIAAMGGVPLYMLVGLVAPRGVDIVSLYSGIKKASDLYGVPVVGGDLSEANPVAPLTIITITVIGTSHLNSLDLEHYGLVDPPRPVLRSGASHDDYIFVTGTLGGAAAGLRYLNDKLNKSAAIKFESATKPQEKESECPIIVERFLRPLARIEHGKVARLSGATAMIDISDGFAIDMHRIANASQVGFEIDELPICKGAVIQDCLGGGDDYELIFTAPNRRLVEANFAKKGLEVYLVGRCKSAKGGFFRDGTVVESVGWQHSF